jgi:translation initiation factor 2B subunit (eIF-2B alpha/beta/delta family)
LAVESAPRFGEVQQVRHTARAFQQELEQSPRRLVRAALPLLSADSQVLTWSYSSTVLEVLRAAQALGVRVTVFCTESRPILEGRRLAQQLADAGIKVSFGIDAALSTFAPQASLALVGADSITSVGVVNKVGTTTLALAAREAHIPCFVIGGRQKCFPAAAPLPDFHPPRPIDEVWPDPPAGISIWNAYFECTPLTLFNGIVMEAGVLAPEELMRELVNLPVAEVLRERRV